MKKTNPKTHFSPGVRVTTHDGITVEISGSAPVFDSMLARMSRDALKECQRIRKENLGRRSEF